MVEKTVKICDVCEDSVAKHKCPFCEKDICSECSEELEVGTISLTTCENCANKIEHSAGREKNFWKEFNKNEDMENKLISHIKKKLILTNLESEEEKDEDDEEDYSVPYPQFARKRAIRRLKKGKGWGEDMGEKTV